MANDPILYDDNNPESIIGYEVYCDGCDKVMGATDDEIKTLVLCSTCTPECCTDETLKDAAKHGDDSAQEEINRRSVRTNADGSASFVGEVKLPW
jgi:hypothetical protein